MLMDNVRTYLQERRAMGFDLHKTERLLRQFADFAMSRGDTHIRAQTAVEWAGAARTLGEKRCRLRRVVLFARHMRAEDDHHEVPPNGVFAPSPRQFTPYIYTPQEAQQIVTEAGRLGPAGSLRPYVLSTLFALLFATGLRISEALALRFDAVQGDGLLIHQTKFRKSRFVPLHETAQVGLGKFLARRREVGGATEYVFVNVYGRRLRYMSVQPVFRQILVNTGIGPWPNGRWPRIHDIRHTVAVRALETSPDGRDRIAQHMLALCTYLGHTRITSTYWYLQATPCLMRGIADACQSLLDGGRQ